MVPLFRYSTMPKFPITELIEETRVKELDMRTADRRGDDCKYLKTGSAYHAPSAAAVKMVEAILIDRRNNLPCAAYFRGEYGISGLYVGVQCKLGANGLEDNTGIKSADAVKELSMMMGVV